MASYVHAHTWFPAREAEGHAGGRWRMPAYVAAVSLAGATGLLAFTAGGQSRPVVVVTLLAAAVGLSLHKLRLPLASSYATVSMAHVVDFVALLVVGTTAATVIAALGTLLQCTARVRRPQPWYRTAYSVAAVAIAVQAAGHVWATWGGVFAEMEAMATVAPLSMTATAYFLVNTGLISAAVASSSAASPMRAWYWDFLWGAPSYFLSAFLAGAVALTIVNEVYLLLPFAIAPLYLSVRAYQIWVARIETERRHAQELGAMVARAQEALERATTSETALAAEKERLALESARLGATLRTISDGVVSVAADGQVLVMNEGARRLGATGPEQGAPSMTAILTAVGIASAVAEDALGQVLGNGRAVRLRNDVDGETPVRHIEVIGTPTRDAGDHVSGAVWVLRDISELECMQRERAKAARLESLGVLAGGLAHDFNNILMGIVGNVSMAMTYASGPDRALTTLLREAEAACLRARGVTNQLLTFSKGGAPVKQTASLSELVPECARFALSGSSVAPRFALQDDAWQADVDPVQIGQVIHNLVLNAQQAMPRGGVVDIRLENIALEADGGVPDLSAGRYARIVVQDTGSGIDPEHLTRIFEPYFTTKEHGSGLGLAISYSIVRAHGGAIRVESPAGGGTRFEIYLPASARQQPVVERPKPAVAAGPRRVLVMDDESMVAAVVGSMLEHLGCAVTIAPSGEAAIEACKTAVAEGEAFDLAILDLTVPGGMGGADAIHHLRAITPELTAVVTSGYADDPVLARYRDYGFDGILPKPFALRDLRTALTALQERSLDADADAGDMSAVCLASLGESSRVH